MNEYLSIFAMYDCLAIIILLYLIAMKRFPADSVAFQFSHHLVKK